MTSDTKKILRQLMKQKSNKESSNNQFKYVPQDEFSHKHSLITNPESKNVTNYEDLLSKDLATANIDDAYLLQLNSAHFRLVQVQLMQMREEATNEDLKIILGKLFNFFHIAFIGDLKMTRSLKGFERNLQANIMTSQKEPEKQGFRIPRPKSNNSQDEVQLYD